MHTLFHTNALLHISPWHWPKQKIRPKIGMKAIFPTELLTAQVVIVKYNGFLVVLCRIVLPLKYFILWFEMADMIYVSEQVTIAKTYLHVIL